MVQENSVIYDLDDEEVITDHDGACNHEVNSSCNQAAHTSDKPVLKKGLWTAEEDNILTEYVNKYGEGNWHLVQKLCGLPRDNKSCRLRWVNHLQGKLKQGSFTKEEEDTVDRLQSKLGNRWAKISSYLDGRSNDAVKNNWYTRHHKPNAKKRQRSGSSVQPVNTPTSVDQNTSFPSSSHSSFLRYQAMLDRLPQLQFPPSYYQSIYPCQFLHFYANYDLGSHDQRVNGNNISSFQAPIQEPEVPSFQFENQRVNGNNISSFQAPIQEPELPSFQFENNNVGSQFDDYTNYGSNNNSNFEPLLIMAPELPLIQNEHNNNAINPIRQDSDGYCHPSLISVNELVDSGMNYTERDEVIVWQLPGPADNDTIANITFDDADYSDLMSLLEFAEGDIINITTDDAGCSDLMSHAQSDAQKFFT